MQVVIKTETSQGHLKYIIAEYDNNTLHSFVNMATNDLITHDRINVSFDPTTQFLTADFDGTIKDLKVNSKRSELQRRLNMVALINIISKTIPKYDNSNNSSTCRS